MTMKETRFRLKLNLNLYDTTCVLKSLTENMYHDEERTIEIESASTSEPDGAVRPFGSPD